MDDTQFFPPRHEDSRCKAISELIESVAKEQEALARILDAEHKKIEKVTQLYGTSVDDPEDIDERSKRPPSCAAWMWMTWSRSTAAWSGSWPP